ncbi:MAG: hypothetical protein K2X66_10275 [Cyanobacteria bacterium]|nr:hypothetical protein [Cyanobacteriota bacterium]
MLPIHQWGQQCFNQLLFGLRSSLQWTSGTYQEVFDPSVPLFAHKSDPEFWVNREIEMAATYQLSEYKLTCQEKRYLEVLTYLEWIETLLAEKWPLPENYSVSGVSWLDVGAKNWSYVKAIHAFLCKNAKIDALVGIELDGYQVYQDFKTRYDYAQYFIQGLNNTQYRVGDVFSFKPEEKQFDVISYFLPFVFIEPLLAWGLPSQYFKPSLLLAHLYQLLKPGGVLILVNQGEDECKAQELLLLDLQTKLNNASAPEGFIIESVGSLPSSFLDYRFPRYGWVCRKIDGFTISSGR